MHDIERNAVERVVAVGRIVGAPIGMDRDRRADIGDEAAELAATGALAIFWFQGLSAGKIGWPNSESTRRSSKHSMASRLRLGRALREHRAERIAINLRNDCVHIGIKTSSPSGILGLIPHCLHDETRHRETSHLSTAAVLIVTPYNLAIRLTNAWCLGGAASCQLRR